ncbi:MAG: DUF4252 domain-containing protein [Polaribacter sp.]|uniref:DUF4252 domain-containing protein n=1 Tax=Polaribacter sp. TaxID=1920175 RepID=UPI003BAE58E6
MKKLTTICSLVFLVLFASSCKNEKSLQSYLVDTSGKEGFYTGDLPISSVLSAKADVSDDVKETMKSIKKINIVFLPKTTENTTAYETEKAKLKNIFTDNNDYVNLMSMKMQGMNVKIYYTGNTDSIDEVIAFGYGDEAGVGVARLLGENMNPAKIMEMMNSMKMDGSSLESFAKNFGNK